MNPGRLGTAIGTACAWVLYSFRCQNVIFYLWYLATVMLVVDGIGVYVMLRGTVTSSEFGILLEIARLIGLMAAWVGLNGFGRVYGVFERDV